MPQVLTLLASILQREAERETHGMELSLEHVMPQVLTLLATILPRFIVKLHDPATYAQCQERSMIK